MNVTISNLILINLCNDHVKSRCDELTSNVVSLKHYYINFLRLIKINFNFGDIHLQLL